MKIRATALALILVVSMVGMAAAPGAATQQAEGETYSGANVEFTAGSNALSDYSVKGNVIVENVTVNSANEARSQSGLDAQAGLASATDFQGAGLEIESQARASATVTVASGAEMESHDNERGVLQIRATGDDQIVSAELGEGAEADSESDRRVVVTSADGSQGAFIVVGDGEVVVDDDGGVTAEVEQGGELVYRQYDGERSDDDEEAERMIEEGVATAEVYVHETQDEGEDTVADAVEYGEEVTVEVVSESESTVELTAERAEDEGTVLLTSISEAAFERAEDVEVFLDGEAVVQADSMGEVEGSATDGDEPRYYLSQSTSTEATTDVAVGIDGFSERTVELTSEDADDGDGIAADGNGFGALAALAGLLASFAALRRR